jgi:hypothetical protein
VKEKFSIKNLINSLNKRLKLKRKHSSPNTKSFVPGKKFVLNSKHPTSSNKQSKSRWINKLNVKNKLFKILLILSIPLLIAAVIYFGLQVVLNFRNTNNHETAIKYINGLDKVPEIKDSEQVFQDVNQDLTVQKFYDKGYIIYRLPIDKNINYVYDYYKEELPKQGWKFEGQISVADVTKRFGQFWTKGSIGLRIYSDINDIWYQKLSSEQSKTFLAEEVLKEKEIKDILGKKNLIGLIPNYPWSMLIPSNYIVSYKTIGDNPGQTAIFKNIQEEETVYLQPIVMNSGELYITQLTDYCKRNGYSISFTAEVESKFGILVNFQIQKEKLIYFGYILNNSETETIYLVYSDKKDGVLTIYIIDNIVAVKQTKR